MGRALHDAVPAARLVFEEVDEALGRAAQPTDLRGPGGAAAADRECPAGADGDLARRGARARGAGAAGGSPSSAACVAGHSLGEYSALAAAGSLAIGDAARLLRAARPGDAGGGRRSARAPWRRSSASSSSRSSRSRGEASAVGVCDLANDNAPGQAVVSGSRAAVERAVELAKAQGARRSMLLPVSAPFHCRLLAPAAEAVRAALADDRAAGAGGAGDHQRHRAPRDARRRRCARAWSSRSTARVRWRESLLAMAGLGVEATVELGAGRVLTGLPSGRCRRCATSALGTPDGDRRVRRRPRRLIVASGGMRDVRSVRPDRAGDRRVGRHRRRHRPAAARARAPRWCWPAAAARRWTRSPRRSASGPGSRSPSSPSPRPPERLIAAAEAEGGLDILVNNAGLTRDNLALRHEGRGLADRARRQSVRRLPADPRGAARHDAAALGPHRQHHLDRRRHRQSGPGQLCRRQGRA